MNEKLSEILFSGKGTDCEVSSASVYLLSDRNRENKIFESKDVQLCIKKAFEQKEDAEVVVNAVFKKHKETITISCSVSKM